MLRLLDKLDCCVMVQVAGWINCDYVSAPNIAQNVNKQGLDAWDGASIEYERFDQTDNAQHKGFMETN